MEANRMHSKWSRKESLDGLPWSLLPALSLSQASVYGAQIVWALSALALDISHTTHKGSDLLYWLVGAWALHYILRRVRRLPASLSAFLKVDDESAFQVRLLIDGLSLLLFLCVVSFLVFERNIFRVL